MMELATVSSLLSVHSSSTFTVGFLKVFLGRGDSNNRVLNYLLPCLLDPSLTDFCTFLVAELYVDSPTPLGLPKIEFFFFCRETCAASGD
jgi:hypothetical protein